MNEFKDEYTNIIGKSFIRFKVSNTKFSYYRYIPRVSELDFVKRLSEEKMNFEMDLSQNLQPRSLREKALKTFEGTLAELAIIQFFINVYKFKADSIKWFNVERDDFKYNRNEYDIRLSNNVDVGVRASYYKEKKPIEYVFFTDKMDYILYSNEIKKKEKTDDFEMRVLYQTNKNVEEPKTVNDMINYLNNGNVKTYIIGGISYSEIKDKGKVKNSLGQSNSEYLCLNIKDGPSLLESFFEIVKAIYAN